MMKKGVILVGVGLIAAPIIGDILLVLGLILFFFISGSSAASIVTVTLVGTFGGALCITLTILMVLAGIIVIIIGAVIPSKD